MRCSSILQFHLFIYFLLKTKTEHYHQCLNLYFSVSYIFLSKLDSFTSGHKRNWNYLESIWTRFQSERRKTTPPHPSAPPPPQKSPSETPARRQLKVSLILCPRLSRAVSVACWVLMSWTTVSRLSLSSALGILASNNKKKQKTKQIYVHIY